MPTPQPAQRPPTDTVRTGVFGAQLETTEGLGTGEPLLFSGQPCHSRSTVCRSLSFRTAHLVGAIDPVPHVHDLTVTVAVLAEVGDCAPADARLAEVDLAVSLDVFLGRVAAELGHRVLWWPGDTDGDRRAGLHWPAGISGPPLAPLIWPELPTRASIAAGIAARLRQWLDTGEQRVPLELAAVELSSPGRAAAVVNGG